MEFSVEETGQPPAPPAEGPPSEALANALRLYQQERYMEASVQFQRVVEGETQDAPANVQKAQFFLGKALYHLRFYQSALAIFDEITQQGQAHLYFGQTLQWLALATAAGPASSEGRSLRRRSARAINLPKAPGSRLICQGGSPQVQPGESRRSRFQRVDRQSDHCVHALLRGSRTRTAARSRRSARSARSSASIRASRASGRRRMRDPRLSLARVYTAANRTDEEGERQVDGRPLGNAVEAGTDRRQHYWLDASSRRLGVLPRGRVLARDGQHPR
jgi:hypothetical protein